MFTLVSSQDSAHNRPVRLFCKSMKPPVSKHAPQIVWIFLLEHLEFWTVDLVCSERPFFCAKGTQRENQ